MTRLHRLAALLLTAVAACAASAACAGQASAPPVALTVFAAGTLAVPFRRIDAVFERLYPNVTVHPQFAGSVKLARQLADLHQRADVYAAADASVIPKYLMAHDGKPGLADWYVGFARNALTFVYTDRSAFAGEINPRNWYKVLARPGVQIGRSNPDTDPSGYQTLQVLDLASRYYHAPGLAAAILANAPRRNIRDTETSLLAVLQAGEIDYLAIYRSDALQHHLRFLELPDEVNLGNPQDAALYAQAVAHTGNGALHGRPIVYALTIPRDAPQADWAAKYAALVLGPQGQAIFRDSGFGAVQPAYAVGGDRLPPSLRELTEPWPQH